MKTLNGLDWTAMVLLIIGGINWGLVGFFGFDLVEAIFGAASSFIYAIVGLAAVYIAILSPSLGRKTQFRSHRTVQQPI
ncbi:MAG TPA: DUF378 domain-containing protein [Chitinispirillaceae bacterium]|nr:DUF378 domain-containing protein [Chitinispirillaceae bacterium]